mgnify:CR=1 FL=1
MNNALGMIETYGYLTAVEALDSALKAANVSLVDVVLVKGGLVTVLVQGDVGAVKAAMDASAAAAERVGRVISVHVIPRPASDVSRMLTPPPRGTAPGSKGKDEPSPEDPAAGPMAEEPEVPAVSEEEAEAEEPAVSEEEAETEVSAISEEKTEAEEPAVSEEVAEAEEPAPDIPKTPEQTGKTVPDSVKEPKKQSRRAEAVPERWQMEKMTVAQLRTLARTLNLPTMTPKEIRFGKKTRLIEEILKLAGQKE